MSHSLDRQQRGHIILRTLVVVTLLATAVVVRPGDSVGADAPPSSPYAIVPAVDTNPAPDVFETTIVAKTATLDIGNGVMANTWTYNGTVPGPELRLKVGDTVVVHFKNELPRPSGIHWHGIELNNASDGTTMTQNGVPTGGTFLYRFQVPRPGVYWYHPHHAPTNAVFRGQYGSLIVEDPHEETLIAKGVLPSRGNTRTVVLSDTTVCKDPGTNDARTYDPSLPWAGGGPLPQQRPPNPTTLCDTPVDEQGNPVRDANGRPIPLAKGEIPNIQRFQIASQGRTNEGQTVLTNGRNTGFRAGSPEAPGAVADGATTLDVAAGQGLRIQAINAATMRYMRLRMTDSAGNQIPLVRVGAEGGLLDKARLEGGKVGPSTGTDPLNPLYTKADSFTQFNFKYERGELVLAVSDRSDFVIAVPRDAPVGVATLWTLDMSRTGEDYSLIPTVPVMHLNVTAPGSDDYTIAEGTPLRTDPDVNDPVERLGPAPDLLPDLSGAISPLLDPASFRPPKPGSADEDIQFRTAVIGSGPTIDGVEGSHDTEGVDYTARPRTASTRYARLGDLLELTVTNTTAAHHAFHFHGFSFQPMSYEKTGGPNYTFDYLEFVDIIDVPAGYTLRFRVRLDDRPLMDGTTPGGGMGRWVFHCHIFFHAAHGMVAEIIVVAPDGNEKPFVNTDITSVAMGEGGTASATGTYTEPDGDAITLEASTGAVSDVGGGRWQWTTGPSHGPVDSQTVYITITDARGFKSQIAFDLVVENAAPVVTVTSPADRAAFIAGSTVTVTASVTDVGGPEGLACRFDWDDGTGVGPPVAVTDGTCSQSRTLASADVRTVAVRGIDRHGATASDSTAVVVFDPAAGSMTGEGTITSPPGAFAANPAAGGPAAFALSARYKKGATTPTGDLAFTLASGPFVFQATGSNWLVVKGSRAQLRGSGAVGGRGGFTFLLTVEDGNAGSGSDRLRLKVWNGGGAVVYDNAAGNPDDIDTANPPPITSGNIALHA
jgi:FtsP/CotA-like multicopper oxidase with cupredoxin domain